MPKQRNHPHHHRHRRHDDPDTGMQLPRVNFNPLVGFPRFTYPAGWMQRDVRRRLVIGSLIIAAVAALAILAIAILVTLLTNR